MVITNIIEGLAIKETLMTIKREWVTPVTMGAFLLVAVTGVLMFFHLDTGLNKLAHEWLGWILLAGVVLHSVVNFAAFKRHLTTRSGQALLAGFALLLLLTFIPTGNKGEPPFAAPVRALAQTPLNNLATVAKISPQELRERLVRAGLRPVSEQQSLSELTGPDLRQQVRILGMLFSDKK